jgi:hypothetical protein
MKIKCQHGFFLFEERSPGDVSQFISLFGFDIVPYKEKFTFDFLSTAKDYSILGNTYLGALATKTFEGEPYEIMAENDLIYDFNKNLVVNIFTVSQQIRLLKSGSLFISDGLLLPGSFNETGKRVIDFSGWFSFDNFKFKYSEVTLV